MLRIFIFTCFFFVTNSYAEMIEGPWIKRGRKEFRYVTLYKVKKVRAPFPGVPWIEEDCHDQGTRFASWSKKHSYEITYSGSVDFSLLGFMDLGFGAEKSRSVEITFQRWVTPELGVKARHVLFEEYEIWEGKTFKEKLIDSEIIRDEDSYAFKLDKMNYGISVSRTVIEKCNNTY
jgi:hypothetical protein